MYPNGRSAAPWNSVRTEFEDALAFGGIVSVWCFADRTLVTRGVVARSTTA